MRKLTPCIIGLGYVGLPVFISLNKKFKVIGYDKNKSRVKDLKKFIDTNNEFKKKDFKLKKGSLISSNKSSLKRANFFIVTVPTPIKKNKLPDLKYIKSAFETIAKFIKNDDIIFLESTVFPGTTENICRNIIKKRNKPIKFHIGYSSERINPGDKIHNIRNICKVVSINSDKKIIQAVKRIYGCLSKKIVITKKIKETELSKLIENTQRDLNIALMNEIMILCNKTNLDFSEVIRLAKTKWNFLNFNPGLVGGHCLPVDPYYLSYYANKYGFRTNVTLAGRNINNFMEKFILKMVISKINKVKNYKKKKIAVIGLSYKPNVADLRNSLAMNIYKSLKRKYSNIKNYDPIIDPKFAKKLKIIVSNKEIKKSDIYIFLVKHKKIKSIFDHAKNNNKIIIDPFAGF